MHNCAEGLHFSVFHFSYSIENLCGHWTVHLMCWALWSCDHQSDALGFVVMWLSINLRPGLYLLVDSIYPRL